MVVVARCQSTLENKVAADGQRRGRTLRGHQALDRAQKKGNKCRSNVRGKLQIHPGLLVLVTIIFNHQVKCKESNKAKHRRLDPGYSFMKMVKLLPSICCKHPSQFSFYLHILLPLCAYSWFTTCLIVWLLRFLFPGHRNLLTERKEDKNCNHHRLFVGMNIVILKLLRSLLRD